jgi:hypothetical protein
LNLSNNLLKKKTSLECLRPLKLLEGLYLNNNQFENFTFDWWVKFSLGLGVPKECFLRNLQSLYLLQKGQTLLRFNRYSPGKISVREYLDVYLPGLKKSDLLPKVKPAAKRPASSNQASGKSYAQIGAPKGNMLTRKQTIPTIDVGRPSVDRKAFKLGNFNFRTRKPIVSSKMFCESKVAKEIGKTKGRKTQLTNTGNPSPHNRTVSEILSKPVSGIERKDTAKFGQVFAHRNSECFGATYGSPVPKTNLHFGSKVGMKFSFNEEGLASLEKPKDIVPAPENSTQGKFDSNFGSFSKTGKN